MGFTEGDDSKAPGCGGAWCCRRIRKTEATWEYYDYAAGEDDTWCATNPTKGPYEFKFTEGDDSKAPGCGGAWCCRRIRKIEVVDSSGKELLSASHRRRKANKKEKEE